MVAATPAYSAPATYLTNPSYTNEQLSVSVKSSTDSLDARILSLVAALNAMTIQGAPNSSVVVTSGNVDNGFKIGIYNASNGVIETGTRDDLVVTPAGLKPTLTRLDGDISAVEDDVTALYGLFADVSFDRPGDTPEAFRLKSGSILTAIPTAWVSAGDEGPEVLLRDNAQMVTDRLFPIGPDNIMQVTWDIARRTDTPDPASDAAVARIIWYGATGSEISTPATVENFNDLQVVDGRQTVSVLISRLPGADVELVPPAGARYFRPSVQTYGTWARDGVQVMRVTDARVIYAPDVASLVSRVTALESIQINDRLTYLETLFPSPYIQTFRSIANAIAATVAVTVEIIRVLGYSTIGIGGAEYIRGTPAAFTSNGGTVSWTPIAGANDIRIFGADGSGDDAAVTLAAGILDHIRVDSAVACAGTVAQADVANAVFVGLGSMTGVNRKFVIPDGATTAPAIDIGNLLSSKHLARLHVAESPVVVLAGDSISTYLANQTGRQDMLANLLHAKLKAEFPEKTPAFYDRSIGGASYTGLAGPAPGTPPSGVTWWTNGALSWIDNIAALSPDVVVIAMGMNDANSIAAVSLQSVVTKFEALAKVPDLVFCTNLMPSLESVAIPANAVRIEQDRRDRIAGLTRSFARYYGFGVADFHRQMVAVRDGFDPVSHLILETAYAVAKVGDTHTCPTETIDFHAVLTINGGDFVANDANTGVTIQVGPGTGDWVRIFKTAGDLLKLTFFAGDLGTTLAYKTLTTAVAFPGGSKEWRIEVANDTFVIWDAAVGFGQYAEPLVTERIIRMGGFFQPAVINTTGFAGTSGNVTFYTSRPRLYMPTVSDRQFYDGAAAGSGWNHPGNYTGPAVYEPVLAAHPFATDTPSIVFGRDTTDYENTTASYATMGAVFTKKTKSKRSGCVVRYNATVAVTGTSGGGLGAGDVLVQVRFAGTWTNVAPSAPAGFSNVEANGGVGSPAIYFPVPLSVYLNPEWRHLDGTFQVRLAGRCTAGVKIEVTDQTCEMQEAT